MVWWVCHRCRPISSVYIKFSTDVAAAVWSSHQLNQRHSLPWRLLPQEECPVDRTVFTFNFHYVESFQEECPAGLKDKNIEGLLQKFSIEEHLILWS